LQIQITKIPFREIGFTQADQKVIQQIKKGDLRTIAEAMFSDEPMMLESIKDTKLEAAVVSMGYSPSQFKQVAGGMIEAEGVYRIL
jgi:hypothetical protein